RARDGGEPSGRAQTQISEAAASERLDRGLRGATRVAGRMRLRADDDGIFSGSQDEGHAVPVRRRSRLQPVWLHRVGGPRSRRAASALRSEEHTSELQSLAYLVCRLLLEKKNKN